MTNSIHQQQDEMENFKPNNYECDLDWDICKHILTIINGDYSCRKEYTSFNELPRSLRRLVFDWAEAYMTQGGIPSLSSRQVSALVYAVWKSQHKY